MTQIMVSELKQACVSRYPELTEQIDRAHREWILFPIKITILVNGKEYISPMVVAMQEMTRSQLAKQDEQRTRRDCTEFQQGLNKMLERVPKDALAPFLP
ncbi:MAG TPA: hypothetical protein VGF12_06385 [Roseateles sp.]|uniref:hypothetical protein n=1 Tax=Roseateles sp. TaxID=1971397 RepID=UPI002ED998DD